ncbi:acyltransferase [Pseudomonas sp. WS 5406]|uniref:acyltransferase family protein n=1 Tax=Pseudomonas sp. WS 5406 TaxID=2717498 RepID=UPI001473B3A7|nr:acyltransferase [Pseudomonas sp. WS 5406]NMX27114.1 acyltransferase [Pseudomonas sp. WS 5406]
MTIAMKVKHNNCFDLIRHIAALSVLYCHHFAISGLPEPSIPGMMTLGGFAVLVFFSVSGYLVAKSFLRCDGFMDFFARRSLRIFPAYIACCFLMVYALGYAYTNSPASNFFFSHSNIDAFLSYIVFVYPSLPNIFEGYHLNLAINGSIWTLAVEFICYLLLAVVLLLARTYKSVLVAIAALAVSYMWLSTNANTINVWSVPAYLVTSFGSTFFVGALLALTEKSWNTRKVKAWLVGACALIMFAVYGRAEAMITWHLLTPIIIVLLGVSFSERLIAGKFDISYGIYIYAFPIQQVMVNATGLGFYSSMAASFFATIIFASISWAAIEKPALSYIRKKPKPTKVLACPNISNADNCEALPSRNN